MIVNIKTKQVQDRIGVNNNWRGEGWVYVPTGSELAQKITANLPDIELVFDNDGNLVDVEAVTSPETLARLKNDKIVESKVKLAEWLENHPMQYTDGKYYSVTEEKQALLNSNLASYERAQDAGFPYPMKWNAKGEECEEWDYPDLVALSLTIAGYVAPKVAAQQAAEIKINACTTIEELAEVVIDYDNA